MEPKSPKEDDMKPYASAWRIETSKGQTNIVYRLQVSGIGKKYVKAAKTAVEGWAESGEGWNPKDKTELWLLNRSFATYYAFKKWVKDFPFELEVQRDSRGRKKKQ
jgi:hypothetical protein